MSRPQLEINIDYDKIINIVVTSVRRAAIFMGLGVNSANNPSHNDYLLTKETALNFVPTNVDAKTLAEFKSNYKSWVIGNGLREVAESFDIYLNKIFQANRYVDVLNGDTINTADILKVDKEIKNFSNAKFEDKFKLLKSRFSIATKHTAHHLSIKKARNCLSHRLGVVRERDCNEADSLSIKWMAPEIFVLETNQIIEIPIQEPVVIGGEEGKESHIAVRYVERSASFKKGEVINLATKDVFDICLFYKFEVSLINKMSIEYVKQKSDILENPKVIKIVN